MKNKDRLTIPRRFISNKPKPKFKYWFETNPIELEDPEEPTFYHDGKKVPKGVDQILDAATLVV